MGSVAMAGKQPTIAVLSGKGGTGKTFVAVNLAAASSSAYYIDCDVEEPNGHLFLKPKSLVSQPVQVLVPSVEQSLCTACRKCVEFCKFNALALILDRILIFEEICHSCGGCVLTCATGALSEGQKEIGRIERGKADHVEVFTGVLNIGEITGVPIIECLLRMERDPALVTVIDCPPGAACSVMESIADADYCLIVVEPTLFGLHNFELVYELARCLGKKIGVVANKWMGKYGPIEDYCRAEAIPILAKIPYDPKLALLNSGGKIAVAESKRYADLFRRLLQTVGEEAGCEAVISP